jgi:hypothetical protein
MDSFRLVLLMYEVLLYCTSSSTLVDSKARHQKNRRGQILMLPAELVGGVAIGNSNVNVYYLIFI